MIFDGKNTMFSNCYVKKQQAERGVVRYVRSAHYFRF